MTCDIDRLEGAIKLFDPSTTPAAIKRHVVRHRAKKGTVKRFIMETLRQAQAPMTSVQITDLWVEARGLRTDSVTLIVIRKRIGAALIAMRRAGLVVNEGVIDGLKGWRTATGDFPVAAA